MSQCISCGAKIESSTAMSDEQLCSRCKSQKNNMGWVCSLCGKSIAPSMTSCPYCSKKENTSESNMKLNGKTILMG